MASAIGKLLRRHLTWPFDRIIAGAFDNRSVIESQIEIAFAYGSTAGEIAAALCYLHDKDIMHGDLCSGNILLSVASRDKRGFVAKVADFGLSRMLNTTITTATYGTVSFPHTFQGLDFA